MGRIDCRRLAWAPRAPQGDLGESSTVDPRVKPQSPTRSTSGAELVAVERRGGEESGPTPSQSEQNQVVPAGESSLGTVVRAPQGVVEKVLCDGWEIFPCPGELFQVEEFAEESVEG